MAANNGMAELSASALKDNFPVIQPLILKQWPVVDTNSLAATAGDADKVVALIAEKTKANKTDISSKLAELQKRATPEPKADNDVLASNATSQFAALLDRLERRTQDLVTELRSNSNGKLDAARAKVRENLLISLLSAIGLGVIIGLLVGLFRGRSKD